jgi:hypothetical protein
MMEAGMRKWILVSFLVMFGLSLNADPFETFKPEWTATPPVTGPAMNAPENKGREFYSEWWAVVFRLEDGYYAYVRFMIYNLGPGDGKLKVKAKFYDFSDTVIDGELKKPSDLYIDAKKKVKFNRLLKLKKSFIKEMMKTSRDRVLK